GQQQGFTANLQGIIPAQNYQGTVNLDGGMLCNIPNGGSSCSGSANSLTAGAHTLTWSCNTTTGAAQPGSGSSTQPFMVAPGTPLPTGSLNPKFVVLSVIYAPPGQKSTVDYGSSTMLGTNTTITNTVQPSTGLSVTLTGNNTVPSNKACAQADSCSSASAGAG